MIITQCKFSSSNKNPKHQPRSCFIFVTIKQILSFMVMSIIGCIENNISLQPLQAYTNVTFCWKDCTFSTCTATVGNGLTKNCHLTGISFCTSCCNINIEHCPLLKFPRCTMSTTLALFLLLYNVPLHASFSAVEVVFLNYYVLNRLNS